MCQQRFHRLKRKKNTYIQKISLHMYQSFWWYNHDIKTCIIIGVFQDWVISYNFNTISNNNQLVIVIDACVRATFHPPSLVPDGLCVVLTTVTASLTSDSPNTMMKSVSLTWTSSNTASTATGSTAEIKAPNSRKSNISACTCSSAGTRGKYEETGEHNNNRKFPVLNEATLTF